MTAPEPVTCVDRDDLYRVHFVRQSGTCTPPDDSVLHVDSTPATYADGCVGKWNLSDNKCIETSEETCMDDSGMRILRSKITWTANGATGNGTLYVDATSAAGDHCTGLYDVTATKL